MIGRLVKYLGHLAVDGVAAGQRSVKLELADDVSERRRRKVFKSADRIDRTVGVQLGVKDLEVNNGVYLHGYVILCDNGLRRRIEHLLLERYLLGDALKERDKHVKSRAPCRLVLTEKFDNILMCLRNYLHVRKDEKNHEHGNNNRQIFHICTPLI